MAEPSLDELKSEIMLLFNSMQGFRRELAALRHPKLRSDRFDSISDQLDAIVKGTEEATNAILESVEQMSALIDEHRAEITAAGEAEWLGRLDSYFAEIFQACAFQDITGQRVTKVVKSLKFIDGKLNAMVELWGREGLSKLPLPKSDGDDKPVGERLEGPALDDQGVTQEDIDKLFE